MSKIFTIFLSLHLRAISGKFESQQFAMKEIRLQEDQMDLVAAKLEKSMKDIVDCGVFCSLKKGERNVSDVK